MTNKKTVKASKGSTAIMTEGDVNIGLTYTEAKSVALDTFRANFHQLAGEAKRIVDERVEEITEQIFKKLKAENPEGVKQAQNPDFMSSFYEAQKEYAKSGDKQMGGILTDLLVDRSKEDTRSLKQLVLNESINTIPKITVEQADILSIIFLFSRTIHPEIVHHGSLATHFNEVVIPLIGDTPPNETTFQHLTYSGCGTIVDGTLNIEPVLLNNYPYLFTKGFDFTDNIQSRLSTTSIKNYTIPCLNDPSKHQLIPLHLTNLELILQTNKVSEKEQQTLKELYKINQMSHVEIREKCIEISSEMENVFKIWDGTILKSFKPTSVGTAIGHANYVRRFGKFGDISIWINNTPPSLPHN